MAEEEFVIQSRFWDSTDYYSQLIAMTKEYINHTGGSSIAGFDKYVKAYCALPHELLTN